MGVVIRQSFWVSALTYAGVALGYVSSLILFPAYLDVDQIGLIRLIQSNGLMLVPIASMGMPSTFVKYFPEFNSSIRLKSSFLFFQLLVIIAGNLIIALIVLLFQEELTSLFAENSAAYLDYIYISAIILISQSLFEQFSAYCRANLNIILPGYFKEVHLRLINVILIVSYGLGLISFHWLILFMSLNYIFTTVLIAVLTFIKYPVIFLVGTLKTEWLEKIWVFGKYILILGIGNSIILNLGYLLTSTYLGLEANGIFTTCAYIAIIIEMPKRATGQIIAPLYAQFFVDNNIKGIRRLYERSSLNLFLISTLIAIGIVTNLNDLFLLIPKGEVFQTGYYVIILIGLAKVISMATGTSGELLIYSGYRNLNLHVLWTSAILMIILNIALIPLLGINGAALALLLVVAASSLARYLLILAKMKLSPFTKGHLLVLIIGTATYLLFSYLEFSMEPALNIIVRSILTTAFFGFTVYFSNVSEEVNAIIDKLLVKLRVK